MGTRGSAKAPLDEGESGLDPPIAPGSRAGAFVVERRLGAGGSATVYAAVDETGRRVALKVLHRRCSVDPRAVARFETEARVVSALGHPHIVEVLGQGELEDERRYLALELVEGPTLAQLLEQHGALGVREALDILRGVASALEAAHEKGVAHRDLKPDNVLLAHAPDGALVPKLTDFGLAKLTGPGERPASATETGTILGTPHYMAPEQARAAGGVDRRADIYAFGILAYRMLVGRLPFAGEDPLDVLLQHRHAAAVAPSRVNPALPQAADAPMLRLLAKSPEERPATIELAFADLEDALSRAPTPRDRVKRRIAIGIGAVLVAAASAALIAWVAPDARPRGPAEVAARAAPRAPSGHPAASAAPAAHAPSSATQPVAGTVEASAPSRPRTRAPAKAQDPGSIENPYR